MRLLFNTIALLLATTALAAPVPSRSNDALADSVSTTEHTLAHHHHLHHSKIAKHAAHHEETEVEARSLFNDELEERSFFHKYTRLERRGPGGDKDKGKGKPNLKVLTKAIGLFKPKQPSSSSSSGSGFDSERLRGTGVPGHGNPTPFTGHQAAPSHQAGPSNQASTSKAAQAAFERSKNKPLPPLPGRPVRSNTLPASVGSSHHDAPPPYSAHPNPALHIANPGSSSSQSSSPRQPHRSNTVGSSISDAGTHGSDDRFSINTVHSPHLSDSSSISWHSAHTDSSIAGSSPRKSP